MRVKQFSYFYHMITSKGPAVDRSTIQIQSHWLKRTLLIDCYATNHSPAEATELMLINDGQDLAKMDFASIIENFKIPDYSPNCIYAGIHCSEDRKNEYGTAGILDFAGRGTTAFAYQQALTFEVIPAIRSHFSAKAIDHCGIAGFSLGGLSAIDTIWNYPGIFSYCGVFSGSLWWRDIDQNETGFDENINRIIHKKVAEAIYQPGLRFFFEAGKLDETADRNNNGIIDSIDDTLDLIDILKRKGYIEPQEMSYLELDDGKHDITTWGIAFPAFLRWINRLPS